MIAETAAARFEFYSNRLHYVTETGCLIWLGSLDIGGYAQARFNGKTIKLHRLSWMANRGPIPGGLYVCHACDVRSCVNPDHLWLGTHNDNMQDMMKKGRLNHVVGIELGNAKLTPEQVREMKALRGHGAPFRVIADRFGVCKSTALRAINGLTWQLAAAPKDPS